MPTPNFPETGALHIVTLFDQFVAERRYLKNVAAKTVEWYGNSFRAFQPYLYAAQSEVDLRTAVRDAVMGLAAARRLSPTSINDYSRCMNAFLQWLKQEGWIANPIRIQKLKTTVKVLSVLTPEQVSQLLAFSPKKTIHRRLMAIIAVILDTGMRIDEVLNLRKPNIDLDNFLIKVEKGKGDKQRIVPFSLSLRRVLYRHLKTESHPHSEWLFSTRTGTRQTYRNATRHLKLIGDKVGVPNLRFHLLRHTFATSYLRAGGSIALLRKILGHSLFPANS